MLRTIFSIGWPFFSYTPSRKKGSMTIIMHIAAVLLPIGTRTETHGLEPEEVDYLLSLNDPLQAVADKWMERMGDLSDFSFALDDLFQHMETQEKKSVLGKLREKAAEPSKPSAPAREQEVR